MRRIDTQATVEEALDALCAVDPRLVAVRRRAGAVPLRRVEAGFASLSAIVVSQQVSRASADAILARLTGLVVPLSPRGILDCGEAVFREAGLSRPKQAALLAVAAAVEQERLDLEALCAVEAAEALAAMTAVRGIGPWTAEVYLLTAAGHPDVFPAGDVALQAAAAHAFDAPRPDEKALRAMAESWAPWRAVAARLFWAYYRTMRGRDAALLA